MTEPVKSKHFRAFCPSIFHLETRVVPSSVNATLAHGVLAVTRDDAASSIQVDVLSQSVTKRGRVVGHSQFVVVQGVASFNVRKVKSISITPGLSTDNIVVNQPSRLHLRYTIQPVSAPPFVGPPPNPGGVTVSGVTGVQSALEQQIFDLINVQRVQNGVASLTVNSKLVTSAQIHSRDMAALNLMQHELPGVAQPTLESRAAFVGYQYTMMGENIASFFPGAQSLVAAWMASPAHRSNILNGQLTEAGVGVGHDASGNLYFCQEFGTRG